VRVGVGDRGSILEIKYLIKWRDPPPMGGGLPGVLVKARRKL
jgi:hypothetical protein